MNVHCINFPNYLSIAVGLKLVLLKCHCEIWMNCNYMQYIMLSIFRNKLITQLNSEKQVLLWWRLPHVRSLENTQPRLKQENMWDHLADISLFVILSRTKSTGIGVQKIRCILYKSAWVVIPISIAESNMAATINYHCNSHKSQSQSTVLVYRVATKKTRTAHVAQIRQNLLIPCDKVTF